MPTINFTPTNHTGGTATITLACQLGDMAAPTILEWAPLQDKATGPGQPATFGNFRQDDDKADVWYVMAAVADGPNAGLYVSAGSVARPGVPFTLNVGAYADTSLDISPQRFKMTFGGRLLRGGLTRVGPYTEKIRHVFLLMLENRSFDQLLGRSGHSGKDPAGADTRLIGQDVAGFYKSQNAGVSVPSNDVPAASQHFTSEPDHEFPDVLAQLCGPGAVIAPNGDYPPITMAGFAISYGARLATDGRDATKITEIMACVAGGPDLALASLMKSYAVCDQWFCSLPGPTWPNRFFSLAGTSSGLALSPSKPATVMSQAIMGYDLGPGLLFREVERQGGSWAIYKDKFNDFAPNPAHFWKLGGLAIATGIKGVHHWSVRNFQKFADDLQNGYPHQFTLIEPNYGASTGNFTGGSSQHPMDGLAGGEKLLAATYAAIRNSPVWKHSLLIVTYDENGGIYDHVTPLDAASPFTADAPSRYESAGFNFKKLGPRVPAVIISPWIKQGIIDHAVYDHASIPATVLELFGSARGKPTGRTAAARSLVRLLSDTPRPDASCPTSVAVPPGMPGARDLDDRDMAGRDPATPLPSTGAAIAFLQLAAKSDIHLRGDTQAAADLVTARLARINTYGDLQAYMDDVTDRVHTDVTDGERISDVQRSGASDDDQASTAAALGVSVADMNGMIALAMATGIKRRMNADGLSADARAAFTDEVGWVETQGTDIYDDAFDTFELPTGTNALLRLWE